LHKESGHNDWYYVSTARPTYMEEWKRWIQKLG
jgi:hypothetical protein